MNLNKSISIPEINHKYLPALSRFFSPIVMENIAQNINSKYLAEVCLNSGLMKQIDPEMSLGDFFDWIYSILFTCYRNEYIYKNVITNKVLLGKHSLNTSIMLSEFRVGKCKADVVILNGTSTAYEIKSEFDSFSRLENQISVYLKIFDHINVITTILQASKLESILPDKIGILILNDRNEISTVRKSKSNKVNIDQNLLFDSLRKNEYLEIISEYFGDIPNVQNTLIFKECKRLFNKIPPETAHDLAIKVLRNRSDVDALCQFISVAPSSLSAYAMSICEESKKMKNLIPRFSQKLGSILVV